MIRIFLVCVISLLLVVEFSSAATTPEEFAQELLAALEQNNTELFESLIFPHSLELSREGDPDKHNRKIAAIFDLKKPSEFASFKITIIDITDDKNYDESDNSIYLFGNKRATFPVQLEKQLTIFVKEGSVDEEGEWTTPHMVQVLSYYRGQWYMVWPDAIR